MSASASASALPVGARFPPAVDPPPCPERVRAALCQQAVTGDKAADTDAMRAAVLAAGRAGAQLVVLPECWNCPYSNASFGAYAEPRDGPSAAALSAAARDAGVVLVGGSIPERDGGALFNTCLVYGPDGQLLGFHRKLHLFDVDIPGGITFRESETLTAGDAVTVVDTAVGRLGVGVCFDLRFGEAAALAAARGAHALVFPGALVATGGRRRGRASQDGSGHGAGGLRGVPAAPLQPASTQALSIP
jgi:omega-amidase